MHVTGFCFELNGLLGWLLNELGYDATCIPGCVNRGHWAEERGLWSNWTHIFVLVRLPAPLASASESKAGEGKAGKVQEWLVDVGFGAPNGIRFSHSARWLTRCGCVVCAVTPLLIEEGLEQTLGDGFKYRLARFGINGDMFAAERFCTVRQCASVCLPRSLRLPPASSLTHTLAQCSG